MKSASQNTNEDEKPGPGSGAVRVLDNETGEYREGTQAEYDVTPVGRIFIGIGGFKPPAGKTHKSDPIN